VGTTGVTVAPTLADRRPRSFREGAAALPAVSRMSWAQA
jgi:hypothetical protein